MTTDKHLIHKFDHGSIEQTAQIFVNELPDDFCSLLGRNFLQKYFLPYFLENKSHIGFVSINGNKVSGFVIGAISRGYYRDFLLRHPVALSWYALMSVISNPTRIPYFVDVMKVLFAADAFRPDKNDFELLYISVDRQSQNAGVGGQLVDALLVSAAESGFSRCIVKTFTDNADAVRFYNSKGFSSLHQDLKRLWLSLPLGTNSGTS